MKKPSRSPAEDGRSKTAPTPLGQILERAQRTTRTRAGVALDSEAWASVVGPRIARAARPGRDRDGVLTVLVASTSWAQELSLLSRDILERLRNAGHSFSALRFQVSSAARQPTEAPPRDKPPSAPPPPPLPSELRERLLDFEDETLARQIAEAARFSLALEERRQSAPRPNERARPDPRALNARAARAPESDVPRSDRSDQSAPAPRARPPRNRGGDRG